MSGGSLRVEHFSLANPRDGQSDVSALLRRVADTLDDLGPHEVQDLVMHTEITEDGHWHSITVYFHRLPDLRAVE